MCAYDSRQGRQTVALSFLVNRPAAGAGLPAGPAGGADRRLRYTIHPYALDRPAGTRYEPAMTRPGFALSRPDPRQPRISEPGDLEPLADDATVDLTAERADAGVGEILDALDRIWSACGRSRPGSREIAALLLVDRVRSRFGLSAGPPSLHMCFTGHPGTGKTTVALRMAELLHRLGYLRRGHVVSVTRDDLVGQYVGHTAPKTKDVINRAMGGVLFIDEAYYLYRAGNERDYGQESIEILLQYMENHRADLVVIMAGYADRMEAFFASNPGLSSRIAHHLEFPDYSLDELVAIGELMLRERALPPVRGGRSGVP